jgi:hypothetical protein
MGFRLLLAGSWRRILTLVGGRRSDFGLCVWGRDWGEEWFFCFDFWGLLVLLLTYLARLEEFLFLLLP